MQNAPSVAVGAVFFPSQLIQLRAGVAIAYPLKRRHAGSAWTAVSAFLAEVLLSKTYLMLIHSLLAACTEVHLSDWLGASCQGDMSVVSSGTKVAGRELSVGCPHGTGQARCALGCFFLVEAKPPSGPPAEWTRQC